MSRRKLERAHPRLPTKRSQWDSATELTIIPVGGQFQSPGCLGGPLAKRSRWDAVRIVRIGRDLWWHARACSYETGDETKPMGFCGGVDDHSGLCAVPIARVPWTPGAKRSQRDAVGVKRTITRRKLG